MYAFAQKVYTAPYLCLKLAEYLHTLMAFNK